jgi:fructoselysine transporter
LARRPTVLCYSWVLFEQRRRVSKPEKLERGLGLKEATALNMIDMVGIGPFVVIPLVIKAMGGPQCLLAWTAGAALSLFDGCVWAELGAAMPHAGGSYVYLREGYGPGRWGRLMSFLLIWQTLFQAPLVLASGAIGFAQYSSYLFPKLGGFGQWLERFEAALARFGLSHESAIAGTVVILVIALLYRRITTVGKISVAIWVGVVGTILWLIWGGATHFNARRAFDFPPGAWNLSWVFFAGLGHATVQTIYTYLGYYDVCNLGGEVKNPERNIPRAIFISIIGIAILYLAMQTSILGVVPWREAQQSRFIVSTFVERTYGTGWATLATGLILFIAFGSLFSATLGYSRVPYAAALDGNFFSVFGRVHPTKHFPHVSLLALGGVAFVFSLLFRLSFVISAILAMRCIIQFIGQAVALILLRRRWGRERLPFRMWFYPIPVFVAIAGWAAIFISTGQRLMLAATVVMSMGVAFYLGRARALAHWPFERTAS